LPFLLLLGKMARRKAEHEEIELKAKEKKKAVRRARNEKWEREREGRHGRIREHTH
jgi:hypothetical protein